MPTARCLAESLVHNAVQGDAQARIALADIIRATVARVEFTGGRVYISPARPITGLSGNEVMPGGSSWSSATTRVAALS